MQKFAPLSYRIAGAVGVVAYAGVFIYAPSFPTPDKILVFSTLGAMVFGQAREILKRFVPFVVLLLVYESFRGVAEELGQRVNYLFMPTADKLLAAGRLPTVEFQRWWWHGNIMWYDFAFYGAYMLHFVLPFCLAAFVWKTRAKHYWQVITAYVTVSFAGFLTFLLFPAAPPWLASEKSMIEPITRISSKVFFALGINDFPSVYNKLSPNQVAAVPSLHAAYATIFAIFITRLYSSRWRWLAWIYPIIIWVGTIYTGEHYLIDIIIGVIYAVASYFAAPYILRFMHKTYKKLLPRLFGVLKY